MGQVDLHAKYEQAKSLLVAADGQPTDMYAAYMKFQQEYADKKKNYESAFHHSTQSGQLNWPVVGKGYIDEINKAWDKWVALGHKNEIEQALNILSAHPAYADLTKKYGSK